MSRPRHYAKQAEAKRQVPRLEHEDDDPDESEWDDVSGHQLGAETEDEEGPKE